MQQGEGGEGKSKDIVALGVSDGLEGDKNRPGTGGHCSRQFLASYSALHIYNWGLQGLERGEGSDAPQALRFVGSVVMCPWEMPLRTPNL